MFCHVNKMAKEALTRSTYEVKNKGVPGRAWEEKMRVAVTDEEKIRILS